MGGLRQMPNFKTDSIASSDPIGKSLY